MRHHRFAGMVLILSLTMMPPGLKAQDDDKFSLILGMDYASAEQTLELYSGLGGNPAAIADLRGSRIALATTAVLAHRGLTGSMLESALDAVKYGQSLGDDVFRLKEGRENTEAIRDLLTEVKRRNFSGKVVATVRQLFPADANISVRFPLFFVAFGNENIDAYVRRVSWRGDNPLFVGEGEGTPTIVVNLAKAVHYGRSTDERFIGLMSTVAHEVFHAAFDAYKDGSPVWRSYASISNVPINRLLELAQNEGIAYYLTLIQRTRGQLIQDWADKSRSAMAEFNARAEELLSPATSPRRVGEIIQAANTSAYWESFGSIGGMIMAREIDRNLGRQALTETIARGPADFFVKYIRALERGSDAPLLSPKIVQYVQGMQY